MIHRYPDQIILLRETMKLATIVKKVEEDKYLISYYDENNKFKYKLITEWDIMDEKEYEIIKNRINSINKLLD